MSPGSILKKGKKNKHTIKDCRKNPIYALFCRKFSIYGVFAQHGPVKMRIFHPEILCPIKLAIRKVLFISASGGGSGRPVKDRLVVG